MVFSWLQLDPQAAERWALDEPRGRVRDEALRVLMGRTNTGNPTRLLNEFSSDERRREAVRYAERFLRLDEPNFAAVLLRGVLDDPALAEWARERLAALETSP